MKKLLAYLFAAALMVTAFSCKDDDKVDCDGNLTKIENYFDDYYDAYLDSDCEQMDALSAKAISLIRKSKSCSFVKDEIEDGDYSDVEDLIDDIQADVESEKADAGC